MRNSENPQSDNPPLRVILVMWSGIKMPTKIDIFVPFQKECTFLFKWTLVLIFELRGIFYSILSENIGVPRLWIQSEH